MASDRAPLLRPSLADGEDSVGLLSAAPSPPAGPAIGGSNSGGGGGDTRDVKYNSSSRSSDDRAQAEQDDDDNEEEEDIDQEEGARDPQHLLSAATRSHCAARLAACRRRRRKTTAFVVVVGACLVAVGAGFGARARSGATRPGRGHPPSGEVEEREGDTAAGLGDGPLSLPQCYSTSEADPSIGAWRRCDGGAGECSPMGNATLPDWTPQMEGRYLKYILLRT